MGQGRAVRCKPWVAVAECEPQPALRSTSQRWQRKRAQLGATAERPASQRAWRPAPDTYRPAGMACQNHCCPLPHRRRPVPNAARRRPRAGPAVAARGVWRGHRQVDLRGLHRRHPGKLERIQSISGSNFRLLGRLFERQSAGCSSLVWGALAAAQGWGAQAGTWRSSWRRRRAGDAGRSQRSCPAAPPFLALPLPLLQLGVAAYLAFGLNEPIYAAVLLGLILPQASLVVLLAG